MTTLTYKVLTVITIQVHVSDIFFIDVRITLALEVNFVNLTPASLATACRKRK